MLLLAEQTARPDTIDILAISAVALVLLGAPLLGFIFMAIDIRTYLKSLRRALVVVKGYVTTMPYWVHRDEPPCLKALGLSLPCTRDEVLAAYRERVKTIHPDAGGTRAEFARLQQNFEQALSLASVEA